MTDDPLRRDVLKTGGILAGRMLAGGMLLSGVAGLRPAYASTPTAPSPDVVDAPAGRLRGTVEGGLTVFKGVPYAAPPAGPLRWRPAQPHPGWAGTLDATAFGPSAPQLYREGGDQVLGTHGSPPFDEDCLTLNIWTPGAGEAKRPVLVWIHGGGFISGSGSLPNYSGETFARNGDVVVVTINYRLGPLGYLYFGEDGAAGNFWLTDQIAALRWVRDNIAAFGGDPDEITVAGQSGGALSVAALAGARPKGRPLFRRAVLQSPPLGLRIPTRAESLERTAAYLDILGAKDVTELRGIPWPRLIAATIEMFGRTAQWGYWSTPFLPVLDGVTLARQPADLLVDGPGGDIEVLLGWTREEANFAFALNPAYAAATREQVLGRTRDTFGSRAAEAYTAYEEARPGARPADVLMDVISDDLFRMPSLSLAERRAARGRPLWTYQFDLPTPAHDGQLGAAHCLELPFAFDNFDKWTQAPFLAGLNPRIRDGLAATMHQSWISFIRTGDPNHHPMPAWDRYERNSRITMSLDSVTSATGDLAGYWSRLRNPATAASR
ncbi:carboxylesterase/lipase family protein [Streptomyces sp. ISL-86]|uniref:carboxylesterase/lipase family protein n=1 Tax=Streptomyces sp. ISL-86 TaxID=2819187 RepID=UPI001BEC045E|nr:carboxylesterase family protein [Streptomyces sp. ISL-86]MBT2453361.1 carboxylesterase family protein [Streptomyces sp. ISL-86]